MAQSQNARSIHRAPWALFEYNLKPHSNIKEHLGWHEKLLVVMCFAAATSGLPYLRLHLGSFRLHGYLALIPIAFCMAAIGSRPRMFVWLKSFAWGWALVAWVCVVCMWHGDGFRDLIKLCASMATMMAASSLIRSDKGMLATSEALLLGAVILGGWSWYHGELGALPEIGNKNAFSLYALPAIYLAALHALDKECASTKRRIVLGVGIVFCMGGLIASRNRSGWLCLALIALWLPMAMRHAAHRKDSFVGFQKKCLGIRVDWVWMLLVVGVLISITQSNDHLHAGLQVTEIGVRDIQRRRLIAAAFSLMWEHPLGVGMQTLGRVLAEATGRWEAISSHNLLAHFGGGFGVLGLALFCLFARALFCLPEGLLASRKASGMVLLFLARAQASHEVMYAPAFAIALGLILGAQARGRDAQGLGAKNQSVAFDAA